MPTVTPSAGSPRAATRTPRDAWLDLPELPSPRRGPRCPRLWILSTIAITTLLALAVLLLLQLFSGH